MLKIDKNLLRVFIIGLIIRIPLIPFIFNTNELKVSKLVLDLYKNSDILFYEAVREINWTGTLYPPLYFLLYVFAIYIVGGPENATLLSIKIF